jgi:class 3 adenylate cyclase/tetratricopeptide (TPR) repeat protein
VRSHAAAAAACAACGLTLSESDTSCPRCGTHVPPLGAAVDEGQRRWLTVTFTDVVGSTELSRRLDPEDYGDIMLRYQTLFAEVAERRGGHVASYAGDGMLAVFGWPTSHERDSDLAVLSAFDLIEEMHAFNDYIDHNYGVQVSIRVGVHSGLAVVGRLGRSGRVDTSVFGDIGNVAARLQHEAPTDGVVVSDVTRTTLRDRWLLRSLGHPELRGVGKDIEVFRVIGRDQAPGPDVARVYDLVDRHEPLEKLEKVWADVASGLGQVVVLEGEAGVGKSRLAYELQHREASRATWLTVHCSPLLREEPFGPLTAHGEALETPAALPREERRAAGLAAGLRWCLELATRGPAVLHVEDAHWADPSTGELLERLAEALATEPRPLLVLCTARPAADQLWLSRTPGRRIEIPPLEDDAMSDLVGAATDGQLAASTVAEIVQRADGLALYAEQLAATIVDAPGQTVPSTLQGILTAWLDRLDPGQQLLLQRASAIGRVFEDGVLEQLLEPGVGVQAQLDQLVGSEVLVALPGAQHKFRHALLQEAAHESMLQRQRRGVHARIATILREQHGDLVDAQPGLLAHHLAEARDVEAVVWFERSATRAASDAAFWEATRHFRRALEVASALGGLDPTEELRLQIGLGNALFGAQGYGTKDTLPIWTRAQEIARELDAVDELTSALNGLATYSNQAGACRESMEIAEEILRVADTHDLRVGRLRGHCTMALNHLFLGEAPISLQHARTAIALYQPDDFHTVTYGFGTDQGVLAYSVGGAAAWFAGRPDEAIALTQRAVQLGRDLGSPISELLARVFQGLVHYLRGESALVRSEAQVLVREGARLNLQLPLGFGHILGGAVRAIEDADDSGLAEIDAGISELTATGGAAGAPIAFVLFAEANLARGATEAARDTAQAGLDIAQALDQHFADAELLRIAALAAHRAGGSLDETAAVLRHAVDTATNLGQSGLALRPACDLADIQPEAAELVRSLLADIKDGQGTRDHVRARSILASPRSQATGA